MIEFLVYLISNLVSLANHFMFLLIHLTADNNYNSIVLISMNGCKKNEIIQSNILRIINAQKCFKKNFKSS